MHLIGLSILIQIACAVHCVRSRANNLWLMVIIFLSIPGCIAYALFEILPAYAGRREVRQMKQAAARVVDPERDLRAAREAVETADTAANRLALADALAELGRWNEAAAEYERAEAKAPAPDRVTRFRLARACFEAGRFERARAFLASLPASTSQAENDRAALLRARLHEEFGEAESALAIYADIGHRLPGGEAQCREAALLLSLGRKAEALAALVEVERRMKRIDRLERTAQADMYDWAARTLAELRADQPGS